MSYSYKNVFGRQRVIPIPNVFLYPRGKYLQFHIWVVYPYFYIEDIMISGNLILKVYYMGMTLWYPCIEIVRSMLK